MTLSLHGKLKPPSKKRFLEKSKYQKMSLMPVFCFFYLLFGHRTSNLGPLLRGQPQSMLMTAFVSIFQSKVTGSLVMIPFLGAPPCSPMDWLNPEFESTDSNLSPIWVHYFESLNLVLLGSGVGGRGAFLWNCKFCFGNVSRYKPRIVIFH